MTISSNFDTMPSKTQGYAQKVNLMVEKRYQEDYEKSKLIMNTL